MVRSWFPPEDYQKLLSVSRHRIKNEKHPRVKRDRQDLHNFIIFMVHTCLRVGECLSLRFRDEEIVEKEPFKKSLLRISGIRGKTGKDGSGTGLYGSVRVMKRIIKDGAAHKPDDLIFPRKRYKSFRQLLEIAGLRYDQNDRERNSKSLRTTGIMYRCMNSKNISPTVLSSHCRTSKEMLDRFYLKELSIRWTENEFVAFDEIS
jgi:integrase